jgi:hypothetical protein
MRKIRMILAGLVMIPAILFLLSVGIGALNFFGGALVYGSQRAVGSLVLCAVFATIAFLLWPKRVSEVPDWRSEFESLPDSRTRADHIASIAASRLGVPRDKFDRLLTRDLNYAPREIMNLWADLAEDFGINLSEDDFPEINSIEALRRRLSTPPRPAEQAGTGQPATRPVDKPVGSDKPQPEAEGRCP